MTISSHPIALVAVILGVGVAARLLADRFRVPNIGFLLVAGIALGPEGIGVISRTSFGDTLPSIVGLAVAIIVFEGVFRLCVTRFDGFRGTHVPGKRLTTVGAAVALGGTALVIRYALATGWDMAFLMSTLLVATGPTVITPILDVVPLRNRVETALEIEGVSNDVTAAILGTVVFETVVLGGANGMAFFQAIIMRFGIGVLVGGIVAGVLWYVLHYLDPSPSDVPQNARLLVLTGALVAYASADLLASEAGIPAVATAGLVLGKVGIPHEDEITEFSGDITLLALTFVFITLGALLKVGDLLALGLGGIAVVAAVMLVIRPAAVFASTMGTPFTRDEKLFMSVVAPRGIIPASVATLFAFELTNAGRGHAATLLVGTVFLVILTTVVLEGGLARHIADYFEVIEEHVLILGRGQIGHTLAASFEDAGDTVLHVDTDDGLIEAARTQASTRYASDGGTGYVGNGTTSGEFESTRFRQAKLVVAATDDEETNRVIAQAANATADAEAVVAPPHLLESPSWDQRERTREDDLQVVSRV